MGKPGHGIEEVARRRGLALVVLFGSVAAGRARPDSDQDVAVLFRRRPRRGAFAGEAALVADLEAALGGREVDLTVLNGADPLVLFQVALHGRLLFEASEGQFALFRSYAARVYYDTEKFRLAQRRYLEKRLA